MCVCVGVTVGVSEVKLPVKAERLLFCQCCPGSGEAGGQRGHGGRERVSTDQSF